MGGNSILTWHENGMKGSRHAWGLGEKRVDMISQNPKRTNEGFLSYKYGSQKNTSKMKVPKCSMYGLFASIQVKSSHMNQGKMV